MNKIKFNVMRKGLVLAVLLFSLFITSCSKDKPEVVVEKFLISFAEGDYDEAMGYCDKSAERILNMFISIGDEVFEEYRAKAKANGLQTPEIEILKVEENGDEATVFFRIEGKSSESELSLKKIEGEWKIVSNKESAKESKRLELEQKDRDYNEGEEESLYVE